MRNPEQLLKDLIAIPSVNPSLVPDDDPTAGEQRVADFLASELGGGGLTVEYQPVIAGRCNLICRLQPSGKIKQRILLAPHLDTVPAGQNGASVFQPRGRAGRIHGRGACDTKGSIAVMTTALLHLANSPARPKHTEIIFVGLVDEESRQHGSRTLSRSGLRADLAIVGEPTRLRVVSAHKGVLWWELTLRGKAAHGARPELGINATHRMARLIDLLLTEYAATLRKRSHPLLGPPTINVGAVHGGQQPNIVPGECRCMIDRRTVPGESDRVVMAELKATLRQAGFRPKWRSLQSGPCRPLETSFCHALLGAFAACTRQRKPAGAVFFSDAGVLAQGGIPSVLFGPGDIAQAHTTDEWISCEQLHRALAMLLKYLRSLP